MSETKTKVLVVDDDLAVRESLRRSLTFNDYTVALDIVAGHLVRLLPGYRVTNTTFEEGMFATILDTAPIPAKIRLFLDFVADHVSGKELRFTAYRKSAMPVVKASLPLEERPDRPRL